MDIKNDPRQNIGCTLVYNDNSVEVAGRIVGVLGDEENYLRYKVVWEDDFPASTVPVNSASIIRIERPDPLQEIVKFLQARDYEVIYDSQVKAIGDVWVFSFSDETVHIVPLTEETETVKIRRCDDADDQTETPDSSESTEPDNS